MEISINFRHSLLITIILLCGGSLTYSQDRVQNVKGIIRDHITQEPLIGATIQWKDSTDLIGTITDFNGEFLLENIPVGRIRLQCDYLGYEQFITPSFLVNTAKVPFLEIEMMEANIQLQEIVVSGKKKDTRTQNEMALLSGRSFSAEETERYAGSIADPSRMATSFAGVQASNDLDNDIVVRGNSAVGLLWRLEGIDIPNPNHFARRGSSGGGISIFSVNMLRNSDFIFGNMPAEYGNALSSVFDMQFRKGNRDNTEYSIRAGLLGLDLVGEGPIKKGKSSYLFNYRYSTLGLLNQMGVHIVDKYTDNNFTDLAYHLHFTTDDNKNLFQVWGIGGLSSEFHHKVLEPTARNEYEDLVETDFNTRMGVTGFNWTRIYNNDAYLKVKVAVMGDHITHDKDFITTEGNKEFLLNEDYTTYRIISAIDYAKKISPSTQYKIGFSHTHQLYNFYYDKFDRVLERKFHYINVKDNNEEIYSYAQASTRLGQKFIFSGGLHFLYHSINRNTGLDPRVVVSYVPNPGLSAALAFGIHSQVIPLGTYFTQPGNDNLPLMKSQQWTASLSKSLDDHFTINVEAYYQKLYNVPISKDPSIHYWMLNDVVGYSKYALKGEGLGRNYGIDLSVDRSFDDGLFAIGAVSFYRSEYSLNGEDYFSSRYDGRFNTSLMMGKEFYFENGDHLQLGIRNLWYGGQWYASADHQVTRRIGEYIEDPTQSLERQNGSYWRTDIRISYHKNLINRSWSLSLDVQNVLNRTNTRGKIWNISNDSYEDKLQAGVIPVISYQVNF